jgi:hypothetical protein
MNKQEIVQLVKDQILDAESFGIDEHNPHEAVHLSINQAKGLLQSLTTEANKDKITQEQFNNKADIRELLMWHPDAEMVKTSCLHYLGDKFQKFAEDSVDTNAEAINAQKDFKAKARDSANSLRELLQYSPPLVEDNMYKSMVEMMDLVLVLTNDIEYSDIVKVREKQSKENVIDITEFNKINEFMEYNYYTNSGSLYRRDNDERITNEQAYKEYLTKK